ncbi:hypothetical protein CYLTODRAFT_457359 [Cylindrobasidium torrendii FP15055 ss-10]|uniref:Uncharacterized protein n=1 Tax=Cylindrobasidium torrendii FP15055 ss-10 TaxID=1314674 RepID=A0A0D7B1C5_9AGAR|nr:hypothetical protein CYLTODRAFT_457359 [Cylindrobasidium torrendii FP15055 ss-10]
MPGFDTSISRTVGPRKTPFVPKPIVVKPLESTYGTNNYDINVFMTLHPVDEIDQRFRVDRICTVAIGWLKTRKQTFLDEHLGEFLSDENHFSLLRAANQFAAGVPTDVGPNSMTHPLRTELVKYIATPTPRGLFAEVCRFDEDLPPHHKLFYRPISGVPYPLRIVFLGELIKVLAALVKQCDFMSFSFERLEGFDNIPRDFADEWFTHAKICGLYPRDKC